MSKIRTTLKEICDELSDGLHKAPVFTPNDEYLFVNATNLENGHIVDKEPEKHASAGEYKKYGIPLNSRTILYSIDGTIGNMARYRGEKCILGKGACYLKIKDTVDVDYIYYLLQSAAFKGYIKTMSTGSTIHHISLETMRNFSFVLPNINEQKKIGRTSALIDSKINTNKKICSELESMAKRLYDYWFVQFDFPDETGRPYRTSGGEMVWNDQLKREIPKGWSVHRIQDVCGIVDCLHSKKPDTAFEDDKYFLLQLENLVDLGLLDLSQKYYVSKQDYENWTSKIEVRDGDIVITNAGRVGDVSRIPGGVVAGIGRNMTAIRPIDIPPVFLYYFFVSKDMDTQIRTNTDTGSFFGSLNVRGIKELKVTFSDDNMEIIEDFENRVAPIRRMIEKLAEENNELTKLRDWLLPMLMNGQATVE